MSAKELGMLHTVNFSQDLADGASEVYHHDLSGQLTEQLQRMVRQGQYYKIAGIDIGLEPKLSSSPVSGTVTGTLRYYAPTRGRCAAYREAFKAMAEAMKVQGIAMRDNMFYDFRVPFQNTSTYANATPFANGATFDGATQVTLAGAVPNGIFAVHNSGVQPVNNSPTFSEGYGVFGSGTDFVLNENQQGFQGNVMIADDEFEEIPFQVSIDMSSTQANSSTLTWQWRPDPALYLAILAGQFEFVIQETRIEGAGELTCTVSYSVAGWKSIMGNPDRKRKSRSKARAPAEKKKE